MVISQNQKVTRAGSSLSKPSGQASNPVTTSRCATQSVGSGLRWNHSRAHALGLLPGQDDLDDGRLQQRQAKQFVDRRVVQTLALGDFATAAHNAVVVEQLLAPRLRIFMSPTWLQ
ncbi:MAG TPA: hypothetical protein PLD79_08810 [Halothiobacillus sp.]|jgi:hypothetical protein|nr:hypothetical protein [Halothiobacillus sp.]HQS28614.1 hypothetical protein [Halothiobacillus sp.]HQT44090.1 hypothetical protein [Halothiobacillus sp.]